MAENKTYQIKIESILGGHSPSTHFATPDQFRASLGIDPSLPINDSSSDSTSIISSGLLRPSGVTSVGSTSGFPTWIVNPPNKQVGAAGLYFIYDSDGSVYSLTGSTFSGSTDLNDGGSSSGNGAAYYDNYVYFARDTTIARLGPRSGSSSYTDDYWVGTLGKTALTNTSYPTSGGSLVSNHVLHRHSDGRLYIADVVDNKGTIHYIQTTKTTIEGDTDDGSTYNKLQFGYGLYPTSLESYGSSLVIALVETNVSSGTSPRAKIAFWDTSSQNFNSIIWVEFPDQIITSLKNINGVLYATSSTIGSTANHGFRVSQYVGGYTFKEVAYIEAGDVPSSGALDGNSDRLLFGSNSIVPESGGTYGVGCVYSLGLQKSILSNGLFSILGSTSANSVITAISLKANSTFGFNHPIVGIKKVSTGDGEVLIPDTAAYNNSYSTKWWSQIYKIGQPFKIKKVRIPLAQAIAANMTVVPKIYTDDGAGTTHTLTTINNTNDSGKFNIVRRSTSSGADITGQNNFWLELTWSGSALCVVGLPITIEYELIDD